MATAGRRPKGRSRIAVSTHGVLFDEGETKKIVEAFLEETKQDVAQRGHDLIQQRFAKVFKHPKGHYASRVVVDRARTEADLVITDQFVIYGSWLEGTSKRNASTRFKGYRSFRKTRLQLRKMVTPIAQANLDKALGRLR